MSLERMLKPSGPEELLFEPRDVDVFSIPDRKTRIATVQNYFFPRLEVLLHASLDLVADIYDVDPYENRTIVYRPHNRPGAIANADFGAVHIGMCGARRYGHPLTVLRRDGRPFSFHPTYLTFEIGIDGSMSVVLLFFRQYVDEQFVQRVAQQWEAHLPAIRPILESQHISHSAVAKLAGPERLFEFYLADGGALELFSPTVYFPTSYDRGLADLMMAYAVLWPMLDASIALAEGREPALAKQIDCFRDWYLADTREAGQDNGREPDVAERDDGEGTNGIGEVSALDSYRFIGNRKWYGVLARDNWTCCSCGRTPLDGVTLEVDHIRPRSRGGTNDPENLQTLCRKCNSGKGNSDDTNLRLGVSNRDDG